MPLRECGHHGVPFLAVTQLEQSVPNAFLVGARSLAGSENKLGHFVGLGKFLFLRFAHGFFAGKGHSHTGQQIQRLVVGAGAGYDSHIHPLRAFHFVHFDFRENGLLGNAHRVIALAVEGFRVDAAEVTDARQRSSGEAIEKLVHHLAAQRDVAADGHPLT